MLNERPIWIGPDMSFFKVICIHADDLATHHLSYADNMRLSVKQCNGAGMIKKKCYCALQDNDPV